MFKKKTERILSQFDESKIIARSVGASSFGVASKGAGQLRGNGVLVLTEDELYFELWVPQRILRIPINHIQGLENPKSFLGKRRSGPPLIQINFLNNSGQEDSVAFQLADPESFQQVFSERID